MRPLARLMPLRRRTARCIAIALAAGAGLFALPPVLAEPRPASGYSAEVVVRPGAIFSGLADDGDGLLVTDLASGRLYRREADGRFLAFGPKLPHGVDVLGEPTGPYRIARHGATYLVTTGWTPTGGEEGPYDHALLEVGDGSVVRVVRNDFLNPFDFTLLGDTIFVIDAGRNSIERLTMDGRSRVPFFAFARLSEPETTLKHLSPTEFGGNGNYEFDAVPTGIVAYDRRLYVSLFGGFPFIAGSGRVVSLPTAGETVSARIEAVDLNAPVDVAVAADGRMLVLEHGTFDDAVGFRSGSGRLIEIDRLNGARQVILDGLTRPAAVVVLDEHTIVVSELGGTLVFLKRIAD
jgi:hypothetical protein